MSSIAMAAISSSSTANSARYIHPFNNHGTVTCSCYIPVCSQEWIWLSRIISSMIAILEQFLNFHFPPKHTIGKTCREQLFPAFNLVCFVNFWKKGSFETQRNRSCMPVPTLVLTVMLSRCAAMKWVPGILWLFCFPLMFLTRSLALLISVSMWRIRAYRSCYWMCLTICVQRELLRLIAETGNIKDSDGPVGCQVTWKRASCPVHHCSIILMNPWSHLTCTVTIFLKIIRHFIYLFHCFKSWFPETVNPDKMHFMVTLFRARWKIYVPGWTLILPKFCKLYS